MDDEMRIDLSKLADIMRACGNDLVSRQPTDFSVEQKSVWGDFVTEVDIALQNQIETALKALYPDVVFIGEEGCHPEATLPPACWLVDPLDGTHNYLRRKKMSAISIAYLEAGKPVVGAIYQPWYDDLVMAVRGQGATWNGRSIHVSDGDYPAGLVTIGTASYYAQTKAFTQNLIQEAFSLGVDIRRTGSAAIDLMEIACGCSDLFFEACLQPWDYAAGALIVEEAGGLCTQITGEPISYHAPCSILAANPKAHQSFLDRRRKDKI